MRKIVVALVLAFVFFSCDNGSMETETNPFVGTWEDEIGYVQYIFTEHDVNRYSYFGDNKDISTHYIGTYTFDGTWVSITNSSGSSGFEVQPYELLFYDNERKRLYSLGHSAEVRTPPENYTPPPKGNGYIKVR